MKRLALASTLVSILLAPVAVAVADQLPNDPAVTPTEEAAPAPEPLPPIKDPSGTEENPNPIRSDEPEPTIDSPVAAVATGYPTEEILRPLTLPEFDAEISLTTGLTLNPTINNSVVRGRFGVTSKVEIGLTYNVGGLYDDGRGKSTFNLGRGFGVDATVSVLPWLAVQATVPMYIDPFAISLRLGAPMKIRLTKNVAVGGLHDFLEFKLYNFAPSLDYEIANEVNGALVNSNSITDAGSIRIQGFGMYQHSPKLVLIGEFGTVLADFSSTDAAYPLWLTAQYSLKPKIDIAGRAGFVNLDQASHSFGLFVTAKVRI